MKSSPLSRWLLAIIIVSILLRLGSAFYHGNEVESLPGVHDQISYHELALRVLSGNGFSFATGWWPATDPGEPTAHWSYLYVLYLTGVYALFGPMPLAARLIQALLVGLLQPLLTCRLATRLFGERVGLVSAGAAALYGYFIFYSGALVTESFYVLALLWIMVLAIEIGQTASTRSPGLRTWVILGIAVGTATLLRQVVIFAALPVLAWTTWRVFQAGRVRDAASVFSAFRGPLVTLAILAAFILPWTIRNYRAFDRFVLLNTNAGFAFFWGNHPVHGTSFIPILPSRVYRSLIPEELLRLNEADMDRALMARGLRFVVEDPVRFALLSVSRTTEYFKFWPSADSSSTSNAVRVLSFGLYLPFLILGLYLAASRLRRQNLDSAGVVLLILFSAVYVAIHLFTWTLVRYRLPIDAVGMPFVALGLVFVLESVARVPVFGLPENAPSHNQERS